MNFTPKLIIGLGNPDPEYKNTYHNAGFLFIDFLKSQQIQNLKFKIQKSEVYMNESGKFVAKELKKSGAKLEEMLIVHDDSDLMLGNYKLQFGRGSAGHHGIENVQTALKTKNFWRLRIGIRKADLPTEAQRAKAGEFVLKKISAADMSLLEKTFARLVDRALPFSNPLP